MPNTRLPKYLRLAREIESRIETGAWSGGRMPSLRDLADEHGVSVVTAAKAVQLLRSKGLIGRTDRSGCYLAADESRLTGEYGLCLRVTPSRWQKHAGAILRVGFDAVEADGGATFQEAFDLGEAVTVAGLREQVRKARQDGLGGIFFLPARHDDGWARRDEEFLAVCDDEGMAVVLVERNLRGRNRPLERDLVAVDDFDGAVQSTRHLLDVGRRRVALVVASPCSSHVDREAGYLHALHSAVELGEYDGLTFDPLIFRPPADLVSKAADRWLADQLQAAGADAVFCYQDSVAVGLIVELLARGVSVPRDVAVAGYENLPIGDLFTVGVTTYRYPSEELVRCGLRVMRQRVESPDGPPIRFSIRGELIVRESTRGR